MHEFWTDTFCGDAGCGWAYAQHWLARAAFHLVVIDPMMAVVFLIAWTLLAEAGFAPKRKAYGFVSWVWLTAWVATFLREPVDASAVDWWGKSYWDAATHAVGIWVWVRAIIRIGPRMSDCHYNLAGQRRNMRRRLMNRFPKLFTNFDRSR